MSTCSNPGCSEPGISKCSACKATPYCGPICQTAHWPHHKEECPGHLRKVGMAHLAKATVFHDQRNCPQILRHADLAATKLKLLKDRPVEAIDDALKMKHNALNFMGRHREALECAKEWYCLYLTKHTHPPAIIAAFALIESCLHNREFSDASLYALTTWETITKDQATSHIPPHRRQWFVAEGASLLAKATLHLAQSGGIPAAEKQAAGQEAINLARRSMEIHTLLHGAESDQVGEVMLTLANILDEFNDFDDDEALRLHERAKVIHGRVQGSLSPNVAAGEGNLGVMYQKRAHRAQNAQDYDHQLYNLEKALPHFAEAIRIYRAINLHECAEIAERKVTVVRETIERATAVRAAMRLVNAASRG